MGKDNIATESYKDIITKIISNIHTELIDFGEPRSMASMPTQASSEFITNKQQGDWAEDVLFRAINDNSSNLVAVKYGKSDNLVAGDPGFESFYNQYQTELDTIGKRPDLLLFKVSDYQEEFGKDISNFESAIIDSYVKKAICGIEVRSSSFLFDKYNLETNKKISDSISKVIALRDMILNNPEYVNILLQKRAELIPILKSLDNTSVRTIDFRVPGWSSSSALSDVKNILSAIKENLKIIQKRNSLSITPKVEDLKVVYKWIETYNVPHFYVQVFFDKIYGISFKYILDLLSDSSKEDITYFIETDAKNQNKTTIKIPAQEGICIAGSVNEPNHHSERKELSKGRLLFYVSFNGGEAFIDKKEFDTLFNCNL